MINRAILAAQLDALAEHADELDTIAEVIRRNGLNGDGYDGPASYASSAASRARHAARLLRCIHEVGGAP